MRVLFCSTGGLGHIQPMRPLAAALRQQGHAVAWATAPDALAPLRETVSATYPCGLSFRESRLRFLEQFPVAATLQGEPQSAYSFPRLFGATLAPAMLVGLLAAIDDWRPDLVVFEPGALAAPLACELRGVPSIAHGYGMRVPASYLEAAMEWFGVHWTRHGRAVPSDAGVYNTCCVDVMPDSLQPLTGPDSERSMRLNAYSVAVGTGRDEVCRRGARPCAYLSFGTVFNERPALLNAAQGLLDQGLNVVVTTGSSELTARFPLASPRLKVLTFVAQMELLPDCDLVVSHGGAGTLLGAAAHGLPQLILPQGADHFRNARALASQSAARVLEPERQEADDIGKAAIEMMTDKALAVGAADVAAEMARMPLPSSVAAQLLSAPSDTASTS